MERRDESARDGEAHADPARDVVARILARSAHLPDPAPQHDTAADGEQLERDERAALRRAVGLSTELDDVHDVEYRQLRLERVVLVGLATTSAAEAEVSLQELAALARTAGSEVLDPRRTTCRWVVLDAEVGSAEK